MPIKADRGHSPPDLFGCHDNLDCSKIAYLIDSRGKNAGAKIIEPVLGFLIFNAEGPPQLIDTEDPMTLPHSLFCPRGLHKAAARGHRELTSVELDELDVTVDTE